jgi:serine/threonine protein kinase
MSTGSVGQTTSVGHGWTLEDYVLGHAIASGKFGFVFHATHAPTGRSVALKLIPRQGPESDEKVAAERHGAILQQHFGLTHKTLVPEVFEHKPIQEFYGIAMEFVDGVQLTRLIEGGPMTPRRAATIALAIADFLEKAHRFETTVEGEHYELIVHADLKPDHILVLDDDEIRVLDFGIAKALEARTLVTTNKWGSVQYASPERLQSDGHVNEHADFWSLGVMLFEMVAGFRPYSRYEHSSSRLDRAIRTHEPPEPMPAASDPVLVAIVGKLLATQVDRRYVSASAIAADLAAYLHGRPTTAAAEQARASQETVRVGGAGGVPPPRLISVPTEPLTSDPQVAPGVRATASQSTPQSKDPGGAHRSVVAKAKRFAGVCVMVGLAATEALGLVRAERLRAKVAALEPSDVPAVRSAYQAIDRWAVMDIGVFIRLNGALTNRLIELADRTILDYRAEAPGVARVHWEQARDCLDLARELAPNDRSIAAKRAYVAGHLSRITARASVDMDRAVRQFRESARLDPSSPDPYLGLARVAAYSTRDVEALRQAIGEAESRGYRSGRREQAGFGDAHKVLGDRARAGALQLRGSARLTELERSATEYRMCIEYLEGLRYFNSDGNARECHRRLDQVESQIERLRPDPPGLGTHDPGFGNQQSVESGSETQVPDPESRVPSLEPRVPSSESRAPGA